MKKLSDAEARAVMVAAGLEPLEPYQTSRAPWKCRCLTCGHIVQESHTVVARGFGGCPQCANIHRTQKAIADVLAVGLTPLEDYPGPTKSWLCRCNECGEEVRSTYRYIMRGRGCKFCSGFQVHPDRAVEVMNSVGLKPLVPYSRSDKPWRCKCIICDREVSPTYSSIVHGRSGCAYCSGVRVDALEVVKIMQVANLEPLEPYPGSHTAWRCRCMKCGRIVSPRYDYVKGHGSGCRCCDGTPGKSVAPEVALAVFQAAGLEPLESFSGTGPWRSKCLKCGREVSPQYNYVRRGGAGCKYCKIDIDRRIEESGLTPLEEYRGAYTPWRCKCEKCGREVSPLPGNGLSCRYCSRSGPSKDETRLSDFIRNDLLLPIISNGRSIVGKELDVYVPSRRIAFEYNGVYWHNENHVGRTYHKDKSELCRYAGIQLIHIWEDDWLFRQEITKRLIRHKLGLVNERVYARNLSVDADVSSQETFSFLSVNHIQGSVGGAVKIGLRQEDELVALGVFKMRSSGMAELARYATSIRVVGGMGRCIKHFQRENPGVPIITFADLSVSDGSSYEKLGFRIDGVLQPDYSYVVEKNRIHKFNYRLQRFRDDPNLEWRPGLSERQLADLNDIPRIWDCGKIRYVLDP